MICLSIFLLNFQVAFLKTTVNDYLSVQQIDIICSARGNSWIKEDSTSNLLNQILTQAHNMY